MSTAYIYHPHSPPTHPRAGQTYIARGNAGAYESPTSRPRLEERHAKFSPPKTGSESGFIAPIPLAKLCSGRSR